MAKSSNTNLKKSRTAKNDEFYTQLSDINNELKHYKQHFDGKIVFCNCDDPETSNFWKYFEANFILFGLKKLISTHYQKDGQSSYKLELTKAKDGSFVKTKTPLVENGDFRSNECVEILKEADIVATNPPFSLFREYIAQIMKFEKKFIVIGNLNAITYKDIFTLIKQNKLWLGLNHVKEFNQPNGTIKKFGNINWYTNLENSKRTSSIILYKKYLGHQNYYPKYDNIDAIEVSKVKEIPMDYYDVMGVPITFLEKYNPNQFEIITMSTMSGVSANYWTLINGKPKFARIYIKRK